MGFPALLGANVMQPLSDASVESGRPSVPDPLTHWQLLQATAGQAGNGRQWTELSQRKNCRGKAVGVDSASHMKFTALQEP